LFCFVLFLIIKNKKGSPPSGTTHNITSAARLKYFH
jgi:hypothetical protein